MLVKELIEKLQKFDPDANVVVTGNGKGASPFIDLEESDGSTSVPYESEDCEWGDRGGVYSPTMQCGCSQWEIDQGIYSRDGTLLHRWKPGDPENPNCENRSNNPNAKPHLRKVVVLFDSDYLP